MRHLTIDAYLDELSARIPAPGGGACAALHAAQAAALTAMVSRYSSGEKFAPHKAAIDRICAESDQLMRAAAELADDDAAAFGAVAAAYQLPRSDEQEKAKRSAVIAEALEAAAQPPARVVAVSGRLVALAEELGPIGNRNVITDVAAARMQDGTWEASWEEPDGRGGAGRGSRSGFDTREAALAHARRVETALRLNRC